MPRMHGKPLGPLGLVIWLDRVIIHALPQLDYGAILVKKEAELFPGRQPHTASSWAGLLSGLENNKREPTVKQLRVLAAVSGFPIGIYFHAMDFELEARRKGDPFPGHTYFVQVILPEASRVWQAEKKLVTPHTGYVIP